MEQSGRRYFCRLCVGRSFPEAPVLTFYFAHLIGLSRFTQFSTFLRLVPFVLSTSHQQVYLSVGMKIKADLLTGNAVVLFAYGLSGSGKTFTVFGPDAVDEPEVRLPRAQEKSHT